MHIAMSGSEWFATRAGGLNRYFTDLYAALTSLPDTQVSASAFGESPDGEVTWGSWNRGTLQRVAASRRKDVRWKSADVIDRHFALYGPSPSRNSRLLRIEHFQGPWADESRASGERPLVVAAKKSVEAIRYRSVDHFIVLSRPFRDVLVDEYGVDRTRISILPPGVDVDRFAGLAASKRDGDRQIVLCVRRLERRMGIDVLIDAWKDVVLAHPEAELRIVGTGTAETELRRQATSSPVASQITFLGRLSDSALVEAYREATITAVPSRELEGFGLIALESLAAGKPVIVTECGGLPDAVRSLDESLIVPIGNPSALAGRISSALSGQRPSAEQCVAHAETFGWTNVAQSHVDLYEDLIAENRRS